MIYIGIVDKSRIYYEFLEGYRLYIVFIVDTFEGGLDVEISARSTVGSFNDSGPSV